MRNSSRKRQHVPHILDKMDSCYHIFIPSAFRVPKPKRKQRLHLGKNHFDSLQNCEKVCIILLSVRNDEIKRHRGEGHRNQINLKRYVDNGLIPPDYSAFNPDDDDERQKDTRSRVNFKTEVDKRLIAHDLFGFQTMMAR